MYLQSSFNSRFKYSVFGCRPRGKWSSSVLFGLEPFSCPAGAANLGPFAHCNLGTYAMMQVQDGRNCAEADKREVHDRKSVPRLVSHSEGSHLVL